MKLRALIWTVAGMLVVLLGRTIAYAAAPGPMAHLYAQKAGGPSLPVLALVVLTLGAAIGVTVTWLAAVGVRERRLLERRVLADAPHRLRPTRVLAAALALSLVAASVIAAAEHAVAWMRRTFALVRADRIRSVLPPKILLRVESQVPRERFRVARAGARAPPAVA